jgi:hypothetical protein
MTGHESSCTHVALNSSVSLFSRRGTGIDSIVCGLRVLDMHFPSQPVAVFFVDFTEISILIIVCVYSEPSGLMDEQSVHHTIT